MANLDYIKSVLHSRNIDSTNIKPYTGLHINRRGDLVLTTPSLESSRVNNNPMFRYSTGPTARSAHDLDHRILSYDSLEHQRYRSLGLKQPVPRHVTRIYQERFGTTQQYRSDQSKTVRTTIQPGFRIVPVQLPTKNQTMISQRFNKFSPFVTEKGNNPTSRD